MHNIKMNTMKKLHNLFIESIICIEYIYNALNIKHFREYGYLSIY
jgi:hypothetical protein